jgi:hypothetical protein
MRSGPGKAWTCAFFPQIKQRRKLLEAKLTYIDSIVVNIGAMSVSIARKVFFTDAVLDVTSAVLIAREPN